MYVSVCVCVCVCMRVCACVCGKESHGVSARGDRPSSVRSAPSPLPALYHCIPTYVVSGTLGGHCGGHLKPKREKGRERERESEREREGQLRPNTCSGAGEDPVKIQSNSSQVPTRAPRVFFPLERHFPVLSSAFSLSSFCTPFSPLSLQTGMRAQQWRTRKGERSGEGEEQAKGEERAKASP